MALWKKETKYGKLLAEAARTWGHIQPSDRDRHLRQSLELLLKITREISVNDHDGWSKWVNANIDYLKDREGTGDRIAKGMVRLYDSEYFN